MKNYNNVSQEVTSQVMSPMSLAHAVCQQNTPPAILATDKHFSEIKDRKAITVVYITPTLTSGYAGGRI